MIAAVKDSSGPNSNHMHMGHIIELTSKAGGPDGYWTNSLSIARWKVQSLSTPVLWRRVIRCLLFGFAFSSTGTWPQGILSSFELRPRQPWPNYLRILAWPKGLRT